MNRYRAYFDEAWKKVMERFFPQLLRFFVPALYANVDFSRGFSFLDKEMERLSAKSVKGAMYVDKLVKVYLKDGAEQWILIHIEVQGYPDEEFSLRMFRYFYRIFDRYGKKTVSMAILTGSRSIVAEGIYNLEIYGSGVRFRYLSFRLMDYDKDELNKSENPMAMVVLASQDKELARRSGETFNAKRRLIRSLYEKGYGRDEVRGLFEFIDWALQLSDDEEDILWEEVRNLEEAKKMPYITSVERIGLRKGMLEEGREMVLEALDERFGEVPSEISDAVNRIEDRDTLKSLLRLAIRCASLEEFKQSLSKQS